MRSVVSYSLILTAVLELAWLGTVAHGTPPSSASAEELFNPVEILKRCIEAMKKADVVEYRTTVQPYGTPLPDLPRLVGTVLMRGWEGDGPAKFKYDILLQRLDASGGPRITAGSDGKQFYLIDHTTKKVHVGLSTRVFGSYGRTVTDFPVTEFIRPNRFTEALPTGRVDFRGTRDVKGHRCYEVYTPHETRPDEALWFISTTDFLPRRVDRSRVRPNGDVVGQQIFLGDLSINPQTDRDPFELVVPDGYEKMEEPAP